MMPDMISRTIIVLRESRRYPVVFAFNVFWVSCAATAIFGVLFVSAIAAYDLVVMASEFIRLGER